MLTPTRRRTIMKFGLPVRHSFSEGGRNHWTTIAFAFVLAIAAASLLAAQQAPGAQQTAAGAQGRGGGGQAPAGAQGGGRGGGAPFTPAAGAKDLRATMFNWMWHQ